MKMTDKIEQMIGAYLNGELSRDEEAELMNWIQADPSNKSLFYSIKDTWDSTKPVTADVNQQLLYFYKTQARKASPKRVLPIWTNVAAAVAILLIGLFAAQFIPFLQTGNKSMVESFQVPKGSHSQIVLADGTKVNLNSNSHLELAPDFSAKNRKVSLEGEAYFEVKSDKSNPFKVQTHKFDIVVTGTKFNVNSYSEDTNIGATLAEGRITLQTKNMRTITLKPGQKITFDQQTMKAVLSEADVESDLAWVDGEFNFKAIPFPDLIRRLERWYDVKLVYEGPEFDSMVYTGRFKNQETIWQVLDALKLTTSIDYTKINFREFKLYLKSNSM
ncbi:FecR domain-containing protein [Mangrovibacterium lignilyticum]|uniref:FecR domain-containing protein n=1 Tax=Mangrovibacterium lignilyticum TaxID=2668052 RepID=UPI0013D17205|nr:FecR domain-containing protein [Mangrovibacterium lignilyticum]